MQNTDIPKAGQPAAERYPHLNSPSQGYVFVVTYGRSGSTLMQKLLNSIDGYCIRGENNNSLMPLCRSIWNVNSEQNFALRREALARPAAQRKEFLRSILETPDDPWFGAELVDREDYARTLLDSFVRCILHPPADTRVLGFKDIHFYKDRAFFATQMGYMLRYFPNARIIFQTRDLEQVARSGWWKAMPAKKVIDILSAADQLYRDFAASNDRCLLFDYSAFSQGLEGVRPVFDFLGEEMDAEKVEATLQKKLAHLQ